MSYTVLMIDDDHLLTALMERFLSDFDITLVVAPDAVRGFDCISNGHFDALILDVMLPDEDGLSLLKKIRTSGYALPIMMLSARGDALDRIIGIELGADDYLAKPFHQRELLVRLQALIRRVAAVKTNKPVAFQVGELSVDPVQRVVHWRHQPVSLSSTEFSLLYLLAQHKGEVVSKHSISEQVLQRPLARYDRSIDVHVSSLRSKLGVLSDGRSCIQTVFRQGYQLIWDSIHAAI